MGWAAGALAAGAAWVRPVQAAGLERPLRLGFFTDVHAMTERDAPARMQAMAARMATVECDVWIAGGDTVHGGFASTMETMRPRFAVAREFLERIGRPVVPVLGNHDLVGVAPKDGATPEADPAAAWRELFGVREARRSFEVGGVRVFVVESVRPDAAAGGYRGEIGAEQREWLRRELTGTPAGQPIVLCSHVPLRTTFLQAKEGPTAALPPNLVVTDAAETLALFAAHRLVLVLQGHLHVDEQIRFNDTTFLMGGAVSGAWWQGANLGTPAGFGVVELSAEARPEWRYEAG